MDRERISRLEALLARVKARVEEPRAHTNGEMQRDSGFPAESSTLQALPPPPAAGSSAAAFHEKREAAAPSAPELLSSDDLEESFSDHPPPLPAPRPEVTAPTRPAFMPMAVHAEMSPPPPRTEAPPLAVDDTPGAASSLEEAFEQYELVAEAVEIAPDAEDDSVRPSVRPPVMIDAEFDAIAKDQAERARAEAETQQENPAPVDELQSQQRLVVAASVPPDAVDSGELEVVGEADLEDDVMDADTDDLIEQVSLDARQVSALDTEVVSGEIEPASHRPTREMSAILESGFDAPPGDENRPVLELQEIPSEEEIEEPPPSSRRPVAHEEVREAELTFDNDVPHPPLTPPPESGRQVAVPIHADLRGNPEVADVIGSPDPAASTFGDVLDDALKL